MSLVEFVRRVLRRLHRLTGQECYRLLFTHPRTCPICDYSGRFRPSGLYYVRPDAVCLQCGSVERHRLLKIWFDENKHTISSTKVLHFAPEHAVTRFLKPISSTYITADLQRRGVDHNWNIEAIDCDDSMFDVVVCNHVLEHVDASAALREIHRILKPRGVALITIPICEGLDETYENETAARGSDVDRSLHFQQRDHVRIFGRDFRELVKRSKFELCEYNAPGEMVAKYGLTFGEKVFILRPSGGAK